jgi:hypothetical protein
MQSLQNSLLNLIQSFVQRCDMVVVKEVLPGKGYEIRVALTDYDAVLSSLHLVKTLAMRAAGLPEGERLITNLVVNDKGPSFQECTSNAEVCKPLGISPSWFCRRAGL